MASSTNYQWSEPDNTSLVKDGALAIRTLGNAIDTSLWNSGYGQAGKNKIINGDFGIWQRGTSFTAAGYNSDRWSYGTSSATGSTISRQTFTPGTAPVAGYEGSYFFRYARTSGTTTYNFLLQNVEDVRNFAGQTAIYSFWAKADAATTVTVSPAQIFGTGGSAPVDLTTSGSLSLTTSWQRFSYSFAVPSISGKTVGTDSCFKIQINFGTGNKTIDLWGAQLEYGTLATPFQTASGGSLQSELAMCQRYYFRITGNSGGFIALQQDAVSRGTTVNDGLIKNPVPLRIIPTAAIEYGGTQYLETHYGSGGGKTITAITLDTPTSIYNTAVQLTTGTAFTTAARLVWYFANSTTAYIGVSAEL